jgi:predicted dehydrogenase
VRVGIVGVGNVAALNVAGYLDHDRCDVVALCDPRAEHVAEMARRWNVPRTYTALEELLADDEIDAVEILTPTHLHHDHVIAALRAGKHVSCQKPIANTIEDAREMQAAADAAGRILRISECFAHYPPLVEAKRLIAAGAIGAPTALRMRTVVGQTDSAFQRDLWPEGYTWRLDARSPGGHLFDDMVHKYAMARWLFDRDIVGVQAMVHRRDLFFEPCAAIFEYDDPQLLGLMEVSYAPKMWLRSSYFGADEFFEVQGDEGFLWVTRCTGQMLELAPLLVYRGSDPGGPGGRGAGDRELIPVEGIDDEAADWGTGFRLASHHFVDALTGDLPEGAELTMSAPDAARVLQLAFAVYEAGNTGTKVDPRTITGSVTPTGWADW